MVNVHGVASVRIVDGADGKPYIEIEIEDITINITTNLAEMIGGLGKGARLRYEDLRGKSNLPH